MQQHAAHLYVGTGEIDIPRTAASMLLALVHREIDMITQLLVQLIRRKRARGTRTDDGYPEITRHVLIPSSSDTSFIRRHRRCALL